MSITATPSINLPILGNVERRDAAIGTLATLAFAVPTVIGLVTKHPIKGAGIGAALTAAVLGATALGIAGASNPSCAAGCDSMGSF